MSGRHLWIVVVVLSAWLAAWMGLGTLHDSQHADSLLPVLVSLQRWTPFFWGQDRFGMLVPLVAMPIRDPLNNLLAQGWLMTTAALLAPFTVARFLTSRTGEWTAIGAFTNLLMLLITPPLVQFDWFVAQPYGLSMCLGFSALIVARDRSGVSACIVAFALFALAYWVNLGIAPMLAFASIADGPRPTRLVLLNMAAATFGFLLSRYLTTTHTVASLIPAREWLPGWAQLFQNSGGVFASPVSALALAIGAAVILIWLWWSGRLPSWRQAAIVVATAIGPMLVAGTSSWVQMNGYAFRYMYPTLMISAVGASLVFVSLFAKRTSGISAVALVVLAAVTMVRSGSPSLHRIEKGFDERMGAPVGAALQSGATLIAGDYWHVWPGVFWANVVLSRTHSHTRVFGLTFRSEATDPLWRKAGREFLIAAPPNDESVSAVAEQHGVAVTVLRRLPGFDLYSGRPTPLSLPEVR